jgi:hypothetical protein
MSRKVFALAASLFAAFATAHAGEVADADAQTTTEVTVLADTPVLSVVQGNAAVNNDNLISAVVLVDGVLIEDVGRYRVRSEILGGVSAKRDRRQDVFVTLMEAVCLVV